MKIDSNEVILNDVNINPKAYKNIKIKNLSYKEKQRKVMASASC
jgi:energy-coupling factor transporter ATP-binding protein EcfA2